MLILITLFYYVLSFCIFFSFQGIFLFFFHCVLNIDVSQTCMFLSSVLTCLYISNKCKSSTDWAKGITLTKNPWLILAQIKGYYQSGVHRCSHEDGCLTDRERSKRGNPQAHDPQVGTWHSITYIFTSCGVFFTSLHWRRATDTNNEIVYKQLERALSR